VALGARAASRVLKSLGYEARQAVLRAFAEALLQPDNVAAILKANEIDVRTATELAQKNEAAATDATATAAAPLSSALSASALARLSLTPSKLRSLADGLQQLANPSFVRDPVDRLLRETLVSEGLVLQQRSVPLGVLLVIFESRPDVLPQLVGLAVLSANGLLLKGGRESEHTLKVLYSLATDAITAATSGRVDGRALISLVQGREGVGALLALDDCIDLVIPRGGSSLVNFVRSNTRIPVLAHADGVCHVYLDRSFGGTQNLPAMINLIVDAKTDYPAACNAMETLLIHKDVLTQPGIAGPDSAQPAASAAHSVVAALRGKAVEVLAGPRALEHGATSASSPFGGLSAAPALHYEYGDLRCCVELVDSLDASVAHIHAHGSGHTEAILTDDAHAAEQFLSSVDAACVFHNASTRFADGQRMGLGAEVGISTARIHARGPVGVDGLCSTKWTMRSQRTTGHTAAAFAKGEDKYLHEQRDVGRG
jgi:delta-1-pyrroline-5-carboxylate synthetase